MRQKYVYEFQESSKIIKIAYKMNFNNPMIVRINVQYFKRSLLTVFFPLTEIQPFIQSIYQLN